jgi:insulysin
LKVFGEQKKEKTHLFFSSLRNLIASEKDFEEIRDRYLDSYKGDPSPLEYAQSIVQSVLVPSFYSAAEIYNILPDISYEEFQSYTQKFFDKTYVEGVFYGNLTQEEAMDYWQVIDSCLQSKKESQDYVLYNLPKTHKISWEVPIFIEQQTHRKGNALVLVLNVGPINKESWAIQKILSQLLQEEFFDELRTKQQTAYRVYSWLEPYQDVLLQYLAIQSSTHTPKDLLVRVEKFLNDFVANFTANVSRERMNLIRHMLIAAFKRQKQAQQGTEENRWLFAVIETLKSISYERVYKVAEETFSQRNMKRLTVMIEGGSTSKDCLLLEEQEGS